MNRKLLFFLVIPFLFSFQAQADTCVTAECHADIKKYEVLHPPVAEDDCLTCHIIDNPADHIKDPAKAHDFTLPEEDGKPVCSVCHDVVGDKKFVHSPAGDWGCLDCHDPHGGQNKRLLKTDTTAETCFTCHENNKTVKKFVHEPTAAGDCTECHSPHASDNPYQLVEPKENLCFICHDDKKADLSKPSVHAPMAEDCTLCHDPHNSDTQFLLKAKTEKDLCMSCHSELDSNFTNNIMNAKYKHDPVQDGSCTKCHSPHASDFGKLLHSETKQLCFTCHEALGNQIKLSKYVHSPVENDGCNACHNVHGSDNPFILYEYFPPTFYNQYKEGMYKLCYECHDTKNIESATTKDGTAFRNGEQNLHYLHVMIPGKGRSCKSCHDVHASEQAFHIRDQVPFGSGGWELPIKFTAIENGGKCEVGCHKTKIYNRKNAYKN